MSTSHLTSEHTATGSDSGGATTQAISGISGGNEVRDYLWRQFANDDLPPPRGFSSPKAKEVNNIRGKTLFEVRDQVVGAFQRSLEEQSGGDPVELLAAILRRYGFDPADVRRQLVVGCAGIPTGGPGARRAAPRPTAGLLLHELVALLPGG